MKSLVGLFIFMFLFIPVTASITAANEAGVPDSPPAFDSDEQSLLDSGKPVRRYTTFTTSDGYRGGRGIAYIIIKANSDKIFRTILDYDNYQNFYPNVSKSKLYKKEDNLYFAKFTLTLAKIVTVTYHCRHDTHLDENYLTWQLDSNMENDFKETTGFWKAWKLDENKTLLAYSVYVNSGRKIPKFVEEYATNKGLMQVATCMKERVETGKSCK